jgi:hypothetical protein
MNQQGRAFSTASIIFTAGVGSTKVLPQAGRTQAQSAVSRYCTAYQLTEFYSSFSC